MMRRFSAAAAARRNPYFFYDLQRKQGPPANSQVENAAFVAGHRAFDPLANAPTEAMADRVAKVFGQLGSREESRKEALAQGITVAGIHVPAQPEEPTNCCMSGCVNCVWELYKDELEEYKELRKRARQKLLEPQFRAVRWPLQLGPEPKGREAASPAAPQAREEEGDDVDNDLNVGIRTFIETERRIRARKQQRAAAKAKAAETGISQ